MSLAPSIAKAIKSPSELEVVDLTKRFGPLVALDQVSLKLKPGTFHALLGENGAGKSTLVKCIMGFYQPTAGAVLIDHQTQPINHPRDAQRCGIGMVYQHFTSVPAMTVAENLVLSRLDRPNLINWPAELAELAAFMATCPFSLPLNVPIAQLAAGQKQKLEILKQLYLKTKILILDEPTSVLTPAEADEVLGLIRAEVTAGHLSVLLISHKFREVTAFADEVTVLRKGRRAGHGLVKDLAIGDLAELMMGQRLTLQPVAKTAQAATPVLQLQGLQANQDNGLTAIAGLDLTVHTGEIVGIAGVSGNGQRELVEVLAGQRSPTAGQVLVNGTVYRATRAEINQHRVFVLPEEPLKNACVGQMSVAENLAFRTFDQPPQARGGWLNFAAVRSAAQRLIQTFNIKTPQPETPVGNLSGGNVQRTVLARELSADHVSLLIAANPCFGLDFAAVNYIHGQILAARNRGVAVLLVSEDLDELLKLSDRLLVISGGRLTYESPVQDADIGAIGRSMAGH